MMTARTFMMHENNDRWLGYGNEVPNIIFSGVGAKKNGTIGRVSAHGIQPTVSQSQS